MKKQTIATLILLSTAGLVHAQSSVTLYGVVDSGLLYTSKSPGGATGQNAGKQFSLIDSGLDPSRFGLIGTEDLGGGLKAKFRLESGFSVANGGYNDSNGNMFGRQAWLALDGRFGEIKAGVQYSPFVLALYATDPRDFSQFGSGAINYVDNVLVTGLFNSNAVSYTSPTLAGLTGSALIALGGTPGNFQAGRQYSASLKYENGGLLINAAIYDGNSGGSAQTPVPSTVAFEGRTIGASYKLGGLTARASFAKYKVAGAFNANVYGGGLDYLPLPAFEINGGVWVTGDRNDTANHSVMAAVGTNYYLSKATTLYAQVGIVSNHGAMNTGLSINSGLYGAPGTTTGLDIGIRHSF
jgi:predicted porin